MPELVEPMLAGSGEFPGGQDWAVEFAWEGLRVIAYVHPNRVRLLSSTGRHVTASYPDLEASLCRLASAGGVVLDGTVVALDANRLPRRRALQSRSGTYRPSDALVRRVPAGFLVGDVLWCDGRSTLDLPYRHRRDLRAELDFDEDHAWSTPSFPATELAPVMLAAEHHGLDALHAKQLDAPYRPGRRSKHLLRLPVRRVRQVVVGGWSPTDPRRPDTIGALLLGVPDGPGLRYIGRVGLRSVQDRRAVVDALPGLRRTVSPFTALLPADVAGYAGWIAPWLIGRVEFADWTPDGRLRLPTWRGLVPPEEVDAGLLARPDNAPTPVRGPGVEPSPSGAPPSRASTPMPSVPGDGPVGRPGEDAPTEDAPTEDSRTENRRLEQHFVYNALNTIASVIRTDPPRARELLLGFADLNRAADRSGATTSLRDELDVVRAYLQLEQARFGGRLGVQIDVDEGLHALPVAALALLSAVRTIVQERIEPHPGGGTLVLTAAAGECVVGVADEAPAIAVPVGGPHD